MTERLKSQFIEEEFLNRFNYVDNKPEELYKEYQYRLFKAFIRYTGVVHEEAVGWNKDLSITLPENYNIIHNKSMNKYLDNHNIYNYLYQKYPYKNLTMSRKFNKEILKHE